MIPIRQKTKGRIVSSILERRMPLVCRTKVVIVVTGVVVFATALKVFDDSVWNNLQNRHDVESRAMTLKNYDGGTVSNLRQQSSILIKTSPQVLDGTLALSGYAKEVWEGLLQSVSSNGGASSKLAVVEVGMHTATQCLQAAKLGFQAHCVEPSPKSFGRVVKTVNETANVDVRRRVHLYNLAAGSIESTVPFVSSGSTGDHVGNVDMWNMDPMLLESSPTTSTSKGRIKNDDIFIHVPSKPLDDVLGPIQEQIYLLKVDTQGFEPHVFAGLQQTLSQHKIKFLLTEFWPRGMDLLAGKDKTRECVGVTQVLQPLLNHGYRLYVLPAEAHPKAPAFRQLPQLQKSRPLDQGLEKYCQWYYGVEDRYPSLDYKMGYWTDFLAVAPGVEFTREITSAPILCLIAFVWHFFL